MHKPRKEKSTKVQVETIRHGLKRALQAYSHEFDTTDMKCAFCNAMKQLKKEGKGYVEHIPEIKPSGNSFLIQLCINVTYIDYYIVMKSQLAFKYT